MNTYSLSSTSRRWWWPSAVAGAVASAAVGTLFASAASTAVPARPSYDGRQLSTVDSSQCTFDARYLPRSPDAVEGWYRSCLTHGPRPTVVHRTDPNFMPWPDKPIPHVILVR